MARPSSRTATRIVSTGTAAVGFVLAAALLGACSASSSGGAPSSPPNTRTTTTTVTTQAPPPENSDSTSNTGGSGGSDDNGGSGGSDDNGGSGGSGDSGGSGGSGGSSDYCAESQLRASIDNQSIPGNNRNGERAVIVDFLNKSSSSCVLYGYPGAAIEDSSGKQVKQATRTIRGRLLGFPPGHNTLPHVTLKPGAVASAGIEGTDQQEHGAAQAGCDNKPYPRILVTPPNTRTPVPFTVTWPICYSFTVHPVNYKN